MAAYADFVAYVAEINDLLCAMNLLAWDARTQMPPGGAATRGAQLATLTGIAQARIISGAFARLIDNGSRPDRRGRRQL
ncbi:MAG: hypothetical protein R2851_24575 [Caldilineaceae bacterium]